MFDVPEVDTSIFFGQPYGLHATELIIAVRECLICAAPHIPQRP
jgi:hypothetical protein